MKCMYSGIRTNNLKNIDIVFATNQVLLFMGPSGSGKSSLAVDTIHQISEDELFQLMSLKDDVSTYAIDDYQNILPSVCLQQENYNCNPRSTIATYFSLDRHFKGLFAEANSVSERIFQFNSPDSACSVCAGLGTSLVPDPLRIVEFSVPLREMPFRCWRNIDSEYYAQILELRCKELGVSPESPFKDLKADTQHEILFGMSAEKHMIEFMANGRHRRRTAPYRGPIAELALELEKGQLRHSRRKYFSDSICIGCGGRRFSEEVLAYKLYGQSLGELYQMEIGALQKWILDKEDFWRKEYRQVKCFAAILRLIENMLTLDVAYLHLGRSIPSLSGGELQRLRLSKAISSPFYDFLYVLDEPTAGLHPEEWQMIADLVVDLKKRSNTIIVIEHNKFLQSTADRTFVLGPGGGEYGGHLVGKPKGAAHSVQKAGHRFFESKSFIPVRDASYLNIVGASIDLPVGTMVGVCGVSGSGKSSFLSGIIPRVLDSSIYLNQAPFHGNAYSIVATAVNIYTRIQDLYATTNRVNREYFSYSSHGKGQCSVCAGKGVLEEGTSYISSRLVCPECKGKRFSPGALRYRYNGLSIHDLLCMDVDSVVNVISPKETGIVDVLKVVMSMGLGYLSLFRDTSSLSGGEAQRVKLIDAVVKRKGTRTYLLDEPFRGVDEENTVRIIAFLQGLVEDGATVYIAAHDPSVLGHCSYLIEFGPGGGANGGKVVYAGRTSNLSECKGSRMARWLT